MPIHAPVPGTSLTGGRSAVDQPQRPAANSSVNAGLTLGYLPEVTVTASIQQPVSGTASVAGLQPSCAPSGYVIHSGFTLSECLQGFDAESKYCREFSWTVQ